MKIKNFIPDKMYIRMQYFKHFKKLPDLKNPKTFNEKLQWLKLNDRQDKYTMMVDKYLVKQYVSDIIGQEYIIPTIGVWNSAKNIDFEKLPEKFVLKWNHDSGSVILCKDKEALNREAVIEKMARYQSHNGYDYAREWPYKNVKPCIIAEEFLEAGKDGLIDYKFYCFNGEPKFLYISKGLDDHDTASISFLTMDWQFAPYGRNDFKPFSELPEKPLNFDKMVDIAKKLSDGFDFLRVDLYSIEDKIYFSELTFYPCAGYMPFSDSEHDLEVGNMLLLTTKKKNR